MNTRICPMRLCRACAVTCLLAAPVTSEADEARDLFQQGIEAFESGDYRMAAEAFRKAYTAKESWKVLYNIGQAEAAATRYGLALEAFEKYLVQGGDDVPDARREEVLAEIQRLRLLVGVLEVKAEPGAELLVDGISRGTTPFDGIKRVAAGSHHILVRRNGETLFEKKVSVAGGITTFIDATPGGSDEISSGGGEPTPADDDGSGGAEPEPDGVRNKLIAGIVVGGVGLVGVGIGAGFAAKGSKDYDAYLQAEEDGDQGEFERYQNDVLPKDQALMITGFAVGGALVATGAVLIVLDVLENKESESAVSLRPAPGGLAVTF
jgi:tetratricopeptide (TPR) repeat protein